jgi:hypothetical protein
LHYSSKIPVIASQRVDAVLSEKRTTVRSAYFYYSAKKQRFTQLLSEGYPVIATRLRKILPYGIAQ